MGVPVPPHVRDRTVRVLAWTLAMGCWVVPFGVVMAPLFAGLWLAQRSTGRVSPSAAACAASGIGVQLWFVASAVLANS